MAKPPAKTHIQSASKVASEIRRISNSLNLSREQAENSERKKRLLDVPTLVLLVFTTLFTGKIMLDGEETTEVTNRAWISPDTAELLNFKVGEPIQATVKYLNTGKEPALNVTNFNHLRIEDVSSLADYETLHLKDGIRVQGSCDAFKNTKNTATMYVGVVYPSAHKDSLVNANAANVSQYLLEGKQAAIVHGCFQYETFGKLHFSEYCFISSPKFTGSTLVGCKGNQNAN